jgi:hypothetical protein
VILEQQAKAIAKHIPFVIGMDQAIGDSAAIAFSTGFYRALGAGRSVEEAYKFACVEIQMAGIPEHSTPIFLKKQHLVTIKEEEENLEVNSTVFFHDRFTSSFPGVRGIQLFDSPSDAIIRLSKLFKEPFVFRKNSPIWWFRGHRTSEVKSFEHLENDVVLLDEQELKIKNVFAINACGYHQCFLYIETSPMEASGIYKFDDDDIREHVKKMKFCREEFAIYNREFLITRAEYDDGAATINGELIELNQKLTELRVRYLSPYNLVIAPFNSPINNSSADQLLETALNALLAGNASVEDLSAIVLKLPKQSLP